MNRFVLVGLLGIAIFSVAVMGDGLVDFRNSGQTTTKNVKIVGLEQKESSGVVLAVRKANERTYVVPLFVILQITIDDMPDFNKAEELLSAGKFEEAEEAYCRISGATGWKKTLIDERRTLAHCNALEFNDALKYDGADVLKTIADAKKQAASQPAVAVPSESSTQPGVTLHSRESLLAARPNWHLFVPTSPPWTLRPFLSSDQSKQIAEKQKPVLEKLNAALKEFSVTVLARKIKLEKIDGSQYKIEFDTNDDTTVKGALPAKVAETIKDLKEVEMLVVIKSLEFNSENLPFGYCLNAKAIYVVPDNERITLPPETPIPFKNGGVVREGKVTPVNPAADGGLDLIGVGASGMGSGKTTSAPATIGPKTSFYGSGGNADHVVYVLEHSEGMIDTIDMLKAELIRSISTLREKQSFEIILLGDKPQMLFADGLSSATKDNKVKAVEFIKTITAKGDDTKAAAALTAAFESLKKVEGEKVIHLLSAGKPGDADAVAALNKKENSGEKKIVINTFQYAPRSDDAAEKLLKAIADDTGGQYKYVEVE